MGEIDISENNLGDKGAKYFFAFLLLTQSEIGKISVCKNGIGREGMRKIRDFLGATTGLNELDISDNIRMEENVELIERANYDPKEVKVKYFNQ
jgi:hypothetical protein